MPVSPEGADAKAASDKKSDAQGEVRTAGASAVGTATTKSEGVDLDKPEKGHGEEKPEKEVIYVDEQGNPVEKPSDPDQMLADAHRLMDEKKYSDAMALLTQVKALDLPPSKREEVLYSISDCVWVSYADNPLAGYDAIVSATSEAMNANLRSPNVPAALLRLGLANINVGNIEDAMGYINALRRRYPDYPGLGLGLTSLGKEQLRQGRNADAEKSFDTVLDKYPESPSLQAASVGLAQALFNQGKNDRAHLILDFIGKRWPRYYIEFPDVLILQGDNDMVMGKVREALDNYWLYYNLNPRQPGNEKLLMKMGDIYTRRGDFKTGSFLYREVQDKFPQTPQAQVAKLRLAEKGIYETPVTYKEMETVFAHPGDRPIWQVYDELADYSRTMPESILVRLKQAMWLYWDKRYTESMGKAADFIDEYPENPNISEAREIIWEAFRKELANSLAEQNFTRILILWNGFPMIRQRYGPIDPPLRYALAEAMIERGQVDSGLEMLSEFLKSPMDPNYGELAFTEFFNVALQRADWAGILDLGKIVADWPLSPHTRSQLDYAIALSAQNLNLAGPAIAMWKTLAVRTDIPLYQRAYATYFLARDAENRRDIAQAYSYNLQVLKLFTQLQEERSDKADPQRIKDAMAALMDICEVDNHVPEALEWVRRYSDTISDTDPEYPGLRFREARLYRKLGDVARAQSLLEDVVRRFPETPFGKAASGELRTFAVSRDLQHFVENPDAKANGAPPAGQAPSPQGGGGGSQPAAPTAPAPTAPAPAQPEQAAQ
jgi:TolA-binding protein